MIQKLTLFSIILLISFLKSYSQENVNSLPNIAPSSPEAAALSRYGTIPVSHATGVPNIDIPIYQLTQGNIQIPISISYHAGGVKVTDIASTVGLGWVLNAGGMISRTVLGGLRDEYAEETNKESPYMTADDIHNAKASATTYTQQRNFITNMSQILEEYVDTSSDFYNYNFTGYTGAFRYDVNNQLRLVPYAPLKIERKVNTSVTPTWYYYEVTDVNGTKYTFNDQEYSYSPGGKMASNSWNLSKIVSVDNNDEVNFYYSNSGENILQYSQSCSITVGDVYKANSSGSPTREVVYSNNIIGTQQYPNKLDSIVCATTKIKFQYLNDRQDGRDIRLKTITITDNITDKIIKEVSLDQSYFGSSSAHNLRMKLDAIHIGNGSSASVENYSFNYNEMYNAPGYYGTLSPWPTNISSDYWGYFNGSGNGGLPREFLAPYLTSSEINAYGGNLNPSPFSMTAYILEEIHYPTGGKTVFEFEPNKTTNPNFYVYPNQTNANNGVVGGLRVKKITNYVDDNDPDPEIKTYSYDAVSSERTLYSALFYHSTQHYYYESNDTGGEGYAGLTTHHTFSSSPHVPLSVLSGISLAYSKVTEYFGTEAHNIGKTEYTYDIPSTALAELTDIMGSPLVMTNYEDDWGITVARLASKTNYKKTGNSYIKVNSVSNNYTTLRNEEFKTGVKVAQFMRFHDIGGGLTWDDPGNHIQTYLGSYDFVNLRSHEDVKLLETTTETSFSDTETIVKVVKYEYENEEHLLPTKQTVSTSMGDSLVSVYKYPIDFVTTAPYSNMYNLHNWSPVIEKTDYLKDENTLNLKMLSSTFNEYGIWNQNSLQIYPKSVQTSKSMSALDERIRYNKYYNNGNIKELSKSNGIHIYYVWGYQDEYPIAKLENFTSSNATPIQSTITAAINASNADNSPANEDALRTALTNLRNAAPNAMVTTYTYDPLIGVTSITDPMGYTVYYEYDEFNRLKFVKDQDENILSKNEYHYKN